MALEKPFVVKQFIAYAGDEIKSALSLAIRLTDEFTKTAPLSGVLVRLKEKPDVKPIRNLSGYYCFNDLAKADGPKSFHLVIESERVKSNYYVPVELGPISLPFPDPVTSPAPPNTKEPVINVILKPSAVYPFPKNSSLIGGTLRDNNGVAVSGAAVVGRYLATGETATNETLTDRNGEFMMFLKKIRLVTVTENGESKKKIDEIRIEIAKGGLSKTVNLPKFNEGTTFPMGSIPFP